MPTMINPLRLLSALITAGCSPTEVRRVDFEHVHVQGAGSASSPHGCRAPEPSLPFPSTVL